MQKLLFKDHRTKLADETREQLAFLNKSRPISGEPATNGNNQLSAIPEVNSTGNLLKVTEFKQLNNKLCVAVMCQNICLYFKNVFGFIFKVTICLFLRLYILQVLFYRTLVSLDLKMTWIVLNVSKLVENGKNTERVRMHLQNLPLKRDVPLETKL